MKPVAGPISIIIRRWTGRVMLVQESMSKIDVYNDDEFPEKKMHCVDQAFPAGLFPVKEQFRIYVGAVIRPSEM